MDSPCPQNISGDKPILQVKVKCPLLCLTPCDPHGLHSPWNSPGQNTGVGSLSLLQGIFTTQGANPGLPHCRRILLPPESPGKPKNTGVTSLSLLQRIFPTQELNRGLLHCRQILYELSYCLHKSYFNVVLSEKIEISMIFYHVILSIVN